MPKSNLSRTFLLPNLSLLETKRNGRFRTLFCLSTKAKPKCPFCEQNHPYIHQYYHRSLKDTIIRGKIYYLNIKMRRFRCRSCKRTFNETLDGVRPYKRLTERMQREIYWACENFADLKKVRKHTVCGSKTIYNRYYKQLELQQRKRKTDVWPKTIDSVRKQHRLIV